MGLRKNNSLRFAVSYVTVFVLPYCSIGLTIFFSVRVILLTEGPKAINPNSLINEEDITKG